MTPVCSLSRLCFSSLNELLAAFKKGEVLRTSSLKCFTLIQPLPRRRCTQPTNRDPPKRTSLSSQFVVDLYLPDFYRSSSASFSKCLLIAKLAALQRYFVFLFDCAIDWLFLQDITSKSHVFTPNTFSLEATFRRKKKEG